MELGSKRRIVVIAFRWDKVKDLTNSMLMKSFSRIIFLILSIPLKLSMKACKTSIATIVVISRTFLSKLSGRRIRK